MDRKWSPYNYGADNSIKNIDPDGMVPTDFLDEAGNKVDHVDDGSNAVYQQTGSGTTLHYEFKGYDNQGVSNSVDQSSAVEEQQKLNNSNPALQENAQGNGETHCNEGTINVMKTVASGAAVDNGSIVLKGDANSMDKQLNGGNNANYQKTDLKGATDNAKNRGLSLVTYNNPSGHGHIATFSTGGNLAKGKIANIGQKKYTGFKSLNESISKKKRKSYFIYVPNVLKTVTVKPN